MPRGKGTPGKAYANRTDLNVPVTTVPNQEYGKASAQAAAQKIVPIAQSPVATAPMSAPASSGQTINPTPQQKAPPAVTNIHEPGAGLDQMQNELGAASRFPTTNAVAGAASNDPEHLRILSIVQDMASGSYSTSGLRDLSEFMRTMVK